MHTVSSQTFQQAMDPVNASSRHDGANLIPEFTEAMQFANFSLHLKLCAIRKIYGISSLGLKPDLKTIRMNTRKNVIERRSAEAALKNFNIRSKLAVRFLTKTIKNNAD